MLHTSKDIKNPGLRTLPPGVERYLVNGGGVSVIEILPEDKIEIINDEGMQICEVIAFNSKGKVRSVNFKFKRKCRCCFFKKNYCNRDEKISKLFKKKNLDINKAKSSILFNQDCIMGEKITLTSKDKCVVMIAAPGDAMNVHEQNPPTNLTIFLNRAKFIETDEQFILPDPLSDPILSNSLLERRTAETYEVKAGEYIQIIDPGGRQCSDFSSF